MKIPKEKWQQWASDYAAKEADDYASRVKLTVEQHIILKAKLEGAVMCGFDMVKALQDKGYDTSECADLKPKLMRGDKTYEMHLTETDGGGARLVHDTEMHDYPPDGKAS